MDFVQLSHVWLDGNLKNVGLYVFCRIFSSLRSTDVLIV